MKLLLIASLMFGGVSINRNVYIDTLTENLTRAAPTLSTEGEPLGDLPGLAFSYRVTVCAPAGQTLSGAGTLQMWYFNATSSWGRTPGLDLAISVAAATFRCQTFPDVKLGPPTGRMLLAPNAVTVSSGTQVTVRYEIEVQ